MSDFQSKYPNTFAFFMKSVSVVKDLRSGKEIFPFKSELITDKNLIKCYWRANCREQSTTHGFNELLLANIVVDAKSRGKGIFTDYLNTILEWQDSEGFEYFTSFMIENVLKKRFQNYLDNFRFKNNKFLKRHTIEEGAPCYYLEFPTSTRIVRLQA